jgi:hypothetical protein
MRMCADGDLVSRPLTDDERARAVYNGGVSIGLAVLVAVLEGRLGNRIESDAAWHVSPGRALDLVSGQHLLWTPLGRH